MRLLLASLAVPLTLACDSSPTGPGGDVCGPYPDWTTSPYVLPYPVGTAYQMSQGNCTSGGHQGFFKHSYDFLMPIGTVITCAREGTVDTVVEHFSDETSALYPHVVRFAAPGEKGG